MKSDAKVAMYKNSDPVQNFSLGVVGEDGAPTQFFSKFLQLFETSRARQLIFGLLVNTDKATSRYDVYVSR